MDKMKISDFKEYIHSKVPYFREIFNHLGLPGKKMKLNPTIHDLWYINLPRRVYFQFELNGVDTNYFIFRLEEQEGYELPKLIISAVKWHGSHNKPFYDLLEKTSSIFETVGLESMDLDLKTFKLLLKLI